VIAHEGTSGHAKMSGVRSSQGVRANAGLAGRVALVGGFGLWLAACGFSIDGAATVSDARPVDGARDPVPDAAPDAPPPPAFCEPEPALRLCFSFDQDPLPAMLPNEGTAEVAARLTAVSRVSSPQGGAAQLGSSSSIFVPMHDAVSGILSIEVWFRVDDMPAINGGRMGLTDSNQSPPNISLFLYRRDPGHELRCGLGGQVEVWPTTLTEDTWHHVACVCDGGVLVLYLDGVSLGGKPGDCSSAGALVADGLTIGSDNLGGPSVFQEQLDGAIDGIRLWSAPRTASQVMDAARP
jgi:hypothetical protein